MSNNLDGMMYMTQHDQSARLRKGEKGVCIHRLQASHWLSTLARLIMLMVLLGSLPLLALCEDGERKDMESREST